MNKLSPFFKSIVMFKAGKTVIGNPSPTPKKTQKNSKNNLSKIEIAFILSTLKNTTFKGDNVELLYNLVIKLQKQYTELDKNV